RRDRSALAVRREREFEYMAELTMRQSPRYRTVCRDNVQTVLAAGVRHGDDSRGPRHDLRQFSAYSRRTEQRARRTILRRQPVHGPAHLGREDTTGLAQ